MLFYWTLSSLKNPEKKCTTVSTKKTLSSTTVFTIEYQHIRVISDGCDTEDWSNDAETSALASQESITF